MFQTYCHLGVQLLISQLNFQQHPLISGSQKFQKISTIQNSNTTFAIRLRVMCDNHRLIAYSILNIHVTCAEQSAKLSLGLANSVFSTSA